MQTTGLVRVTVAAPRRRVDLALPEHAAVAEVLPGLLARAGEGLADDGVAGGGWVLRRADGTAFDPDRTLAAHRVRDGEVLHLAPRRLEWPELEYDDLVDAIATGSGHDRAWGPRHTRHAGLAVGAAAVLLALVAVVRAGPSWATPALWSLGAAVLLVAAGVVLARAVRDAAAGAVVAALALPFAFTGGGLLLAGDRPLTGLAAGHLLLAGAALLLFALAAHLGVPAAPALFAGAVTVGALCVVAGWLGTGGWSPHESAAVVAGGVLALSPGFAPLALRLGRVPMPVLPRTTADLVRDDPQPPLPLVHLAVVRADALLTGMLAGSALVAAGCQVVLVRGDNPSALVLVGVVAVGLLLRARLHPAVRQRVPLLAAGVTGAGCLAVGPLMSGTALAGAVLVLVAALVVAAGMVFGTRVPNPYLGRFAEYAEILVVVAVVPLVCSVLGLFGYVRGLGG
ncbi:type VII secretion integral membrane protein EccD [Saccharothrix sp. NPDC042600]|uniref:type VII secretion integral membrane protein EccD n=1 Tax=Saccharothrix TaxID=2071 RepID=UPI0033CEA642|nr:type VII secretion integral membrane protein EccD [Saccharothrix mutabilis subsp. capreolus]